MLLYNLRLAWKSLRRNPVLSVLQVSAIALGVGVATTAITIYYVMARDPFPGRSERLHYVRMDNWDPAQAHPSDSGIPTQISYRDLRAIMRSDIPTRQSGSFEAELVVYPEDRGDRPFRESVRLVFADFFPMFGVPFRYGGPWAASADSKPEAVVVISAALNDRLFGGRDSVGQTVRIADRDFRVAGVTHGWRPRLRMYDPTNDLADTPESIFMPFGWIEPMEIRTAGNSDGWKSAEGETYVEQLHNQEQVFIQFWAELPDPAARQAYHSFLDAYVGQQKKLGRFQRPLDNRVTPLLELMVEFQIVPPQVRAIAVIAVLFMVVAALNLIGLFLGKFLARAPVVGVRRALGASRFAIFLQHLVECELVGVVGGALGLALSLGLLALLNRVTSEFTDLKSFFELDAAMVAAALALSLVAGAIAGLYPSWRICTVPPADHLKNS
jgi:putative ABC transport system permease protein